jgi:MOSC domain-containing protein YiiM
VKHHGGSDQAVYADAREDLDGWEAELGRPLANGVFGENLTTAGVGVNTAQIGERWHISRDVVLEVLRPDHEVTVALVFRAVTLEPELLPRLLVADALPAEIGELARKRSR